VNELVQPFHCRLVDPPHRLEGRTGRRGGDWVRGGLDGVDGDKMTSICWVRIDETLVTHANLSPVVEDMKAAASSVVIDDPNHAGEIGFVAKGSVEDRLIQIAKHHGLSPKFEAYREKFTADDLKLASLDNVPTWTVRCPQCGRWSYLADDQFHGRLPVLCQCGFYETHDLSKVAIAVSQGS